jgi:hypothetical protein
MDWEEEKGMTERKNIRWRTSHGCLMTAMKMEIVGELQKIFFFFSL